MTKFSKVISVILGFLIIFFGIASTAVSTGLSIAYFQSLTTDETLTLVVYGFVILLQVMVLLGSVSKGVIYKRTPQHFRNITWFTRICFVISVLSTINFFNGFDKTQRIDVIRDLLYMIPFLGLKNNEWLVTNLTNLTLIWASCIVIDLMSMYFPAVGSDLITGISTREKLEVHDKSYFEKVIELITFYPKKIINDKCNELGIISCDEDSLQVQKSDEIPSQNNKVDSSHDNKKSLHDEIKNSKSVEKHKISLLGSEGDEDTSSNVIKKSLQDDESLQNELKKSSQEKVITTQTEDIEKLCNEIDDYITKNFDHEERIKVKDVKEKFGFKPSDRKWNDKVRDNLKSASLVNGVLKRNPKQSKFEIVK